MFKHNWAWIKSATDNFSTVLTRNLQIACDYAPLRVQVMEGKITEDIRSKSRGNQFWFKLARA